MPIECSLGGKLLVATSPIIGKLLESTSQNIGKATESFKEDTNSSGIFMWPL